MGSTKEFLEREVAKRADRRAANIRATTKWHELNPHHHWTETRFGNAEVWRAQDGTWWCGWFTGKRWTVASLADGKEKIVQWLINHDAPLK